MEGSLKNRGVTHIRCVDMITSFGLQRLTIIYLFHFFITHQKGYSDGGASTTLFTTHASLSPSLSLSLSH